jgi:hypothetical protein
MDEWYRGPCGSLRHSTAPALLQPFGQRALAALLALIATRLEFTGTASAVSPQDRDWLRFNREPTTDWKIWIANYGGTQPEEHWSKNYAAQLVSAPTDKVGPEYCNAMVSTTVIGKLCAHMFYSPINDFRGYEGIALSQIWPPRRFDLDTNYLPSLSDQDVLWLHEAYARESEPFAAPCG